MDNITLTENPVAEDKPKETPIRFVDIDVTDDNVALNLMVAFLNMAQRRGAYSMDESAKIWECVKRFIKPEVPVDTPSDTSA
jgi:hypothetical protein